MPRKIIGDGVAPAKPRPHGKCPLIDKALLEWIEKAIPEPDFTPDAIQMAFNAGRRETVKTIRHQFNLQQKQDP